MNLIRIFQEEDLDGVIDLWNTCLPFDPIDQKSLKNLLDSPFYDPDGVFVAEFNGKITGFLPTLIPNKSKSNGKGWILSYVLPEDLFHADIAKELLDKGEEYIKSRGKRAVKFPRFNEFYFFHGIDSRYSHIIEFLISRGYRIVKEIMDIERSLLDFHVSDYQNLEELLEKKGIYIDYCHEYYHLKFLEFLKNNFSTSWYRRNKTYIEENGNAENRILALSGDDIMGFIKFDIIRRNGYLGQIGVLPAMRGKKIGSLLLIKAIEEMKAKGATRLYIYGGKLGFYKIVEGEILQRRLNLLKIL